MLYIYIMTYIYGASSPRLGQYCRGVAMHREPANENGAGHAEGYSRPSWNRRSPQCLLDKMTVFWA